MRSKVKKALCCAAAIAVTAGIAGISACSYYSSDALDGDYSKGEVQSNGGFVVEKGDYIYFINGQESYSADNTYGDVEKGAIVRISVDDYNNGNYSKVDTVVPLVAYSGSYDSGIYIYGDYIYYATPSTNRTSSGEVQNTQLEFKRTKLDSTETMKDCYINIEDSSVDYRFVQDDSGDVYLLYVVSEIIFDGVTSAATNIHSLKLTGEGEGTNTLLAYDIDDYVFDTSDLESGWVYYTMDVTYNIGTGYDGESTSYATTADYNQVYRVCAYDYTEENVYESVFASYIDDYDYDENPLYVNRGELIYDGIGAFSGLTIFNYEWKWDTEGYDAKETILGNNITSAASLSGYSYSLTGYSEGNLYYTREYYSSDDSSTPIWCYVAESEIDSGWNPVEDNIVVSDSKYDDNILLLDASSGVSDYTVYTGEGEDNTTPTYVMSVESTGSGDSYGIMWRTLGGGVLSDNSDKCYTIATVESDVTYLTVSDEIVDGEEYTFLYFSVSDEGNSYSVHRVALYGEYEDYGVRPQYEDYTGDNETIIAARNAASNYSEVKILDLDVVASWYMPEVIEGQFLFASTTDDMTNYSYIMACDLRPSQGSSSSTMCNYEIGELNDLYDDVIEVITETVDDDNYENLGNALYYVFYTRDDSYLSELVQLWVDEGKDKEYLYSEESQELYLEFFNATGDYNKYGKIVDEDTKEVSGYYKNLNGDEVYATSRDYFYSLIGYMSEDDAESYIDDMRSSYMQSEPEEESWWDGLETWVKVIFIVGVSLGGVIVLALIAFITIRIIRKKRKKLPTYKKSKRRIDTTDDKDIDVYSTEEDEPEVKSEPESEPEDVSGTDLGGDEE